MDLHYKREVTVGGLVILGIIAFVAGSMWLGGKSFKREPTYRARFENVGKLQEGSVVKISGVKVGKVTKVEFVDVGNVLVTFTLPPRVVPKVDAHAVIVESIAFAEAIMHFYPGTAMEPLPRDGIIPGEQEYGLFDRASGLADRADTVLLGVQEVVNRRLADDLHTTMAAIQKLSNSLNGSVPGAADEAKQTLASLRRLSDRLDSTLSNPALNRSITRLDTLTQNLNGMTAQFTTTGARLDTLLTNLNRGQGTLGKLATDSGLYVDARAASQSLKALIDSVKAKPGKLTIQVKIF
jgi:phospholipid/cholesterol/gamma-HCH transport system substrate-binding protein